MKPCWCCFLHHLSLYVPNNFRTLDSRPDLWPVYSSDANYIRFDDLSLSCDFEIEYMEQHLVQLVGSKKGLFMKKVDNFEMVDFSKLEKSKEFKDFFKALRTHFDLPSRTGRVRSRQATQGNSIGSVVRVEASPFTVYSRKIIEVEQILSADEPLGGDDEEDDAVIVERVDSVYMWSRKWDDIKLGKTEICLLPEDFFNFADVVTKYKLDSFISAAQHPVIFADPSWGKNTNPEFMGGIDQVEEAWTE